MVGVIAACLIQGCGGAEVPPTGEVSGVVTIDGKPGSNIRVMYSPQGKGRTSNGLTDENGNYSLTYSPNATGALIGKHSVSIGTPEPPVDDAGPVTKKRLTSTGIPSKYVEVTKEVEVKAGSNKIDLVYP